MREAERLSGALLPEVVRVSDNGPPFATKRFRQWVKEAEFPLCHIQARAHHPQNTGMVESYRQSLKYEKVWMNDYRDPSETRYRIEQYRVSISLRNPLLATKRSPLDWGRDLSLLLLAICGWNQPAALGSCLLAG